METIKDYHNMYLKCDVLLLADICEKSKNCSLKKYGLCSSYYSSTPGLSRDDALNMAKTELELILKAKMYCLFEKAIKVESFNISERYNKANNIHLKSCDPKEESKCTIYTDPNNLSGYAMSKKTPDLVTFTEEILNGKLQFL